MSNFPMTGRELRAQLRAQLGRNTTATPVVVGSSESCAPAAPMPASNPEAPLRRWQGHVPGTQPVEATFLPAAMRADVAAPTPGARIEPLPESPQRTATAAEAAELRGLVALVAAKWPEDQRAEALAAALADPEAALMSFRLLVGKSGSPEAGS